MLHEKIHFTADSYIIIAEDDMVMRKALRRTVEAVVSKVDKNCSVIDVTDGAYAIETIIELIEDGREVKCFITDENMTYVNGSDAILLLKKLMNTNKIDRFPFFSCSAFLDDNYKEKMKSVGVSKILEKPFTKKSLEDAFEEARLNTIVKRNK